MNIKIDLSQYDNSWYHPGNPLKIVLWYFINILILINPLNPFRSLRVFTLQLFGATIGTGVVLKPGISVKYPWFLEIGNNVWIGENVWIDNLAKVTIKNNVCISQGAMLLCGNHNYTKSSFDLMVGAIVLEEGAWVGAKSIVCPNVTLQSHSILTVGSVATKDLEAYFIYQGNPAIKVRERIFK